ncbi:MAG: hypothetical protein JW944_14290 [Deltaproteobacteria bacterium]|nr:hypothetical protein [Deltaproteobacteria bacterium]
MKNKQQTKKKTKTAGAGKGLKAQVEGILSQVDNSLETSGEADKKKLLQQLNEIEKKVRDAGGKDQDWLISEINLRKGRCAREVLEKQQEYKLWKHAYDLALKIGNHEVVVQSGLELGFDLYEFTTSIREITEIHMNCVRAVCAQGAAIHTRLRIIGINLFNFWRQIQYRRLSEHDLRAKQMIIDSAKSLEKAEFDEDRAAPVMIMLIAGLYGYDDPSLEWAHLETAVLDVQLPEDVRKKIGAPSPPPGS